MKKTILKKAVSLFTAAVMATGLSISSLSVSAADTYGKEYALENFLTDYIYFVEENANLYGHTVGSVVVGGNLNATVPGQDAGVAPSYAENLVQWNVSPTTSYNYTDRKVYYNNAAEQYVGFEDTVSNIKVAYEQNTDFINVDAAFDSIRAESQSLADNAEKKFTEADVEVKPQWTYNISSNPVRVLKINAQEAESCTIPYELYRTINLILVEADNVDYFEDNKCIISIDGYDAEMYADDNAKLMFGYVGDYTPGTVSVKYTFNNLQNDSVGTLSKMSAQINGGQCSYGGMKLVWNFTDAAKVETDYPGGHIVAPNADVNVTGGRFEGSVTSKNVTTSAQGHFYTFNEVDEKVNFDGTIPESLPKPTPAPTAEPTPEPTVEPTAEPTPDVILPKGPAKDYTGFKYAYIFGYEPYNDGDDIVLKMAPKDKMTREQICAMLVRVDDQYNDKIGKKRVLEEGIFNDDANESRWSYHALATVAEKQAFAGKTELDPAGHVSRGEVARITAFMLGLTEYDDSIDFADIKGDENEVYIKLMATAGYMQGYEDGTFKPAAAITRAEFCSVLNNAIGRTSENGYILETADGTPVTHDTYHFCDLKPSDWYYETMLYATSAFDGSYVNLETRSQNIRNKLDSYDSQFDY